ncbi:MAG: hypothetical protein QOD39_2439 [Mycobacterium sp.]|nr:hypothetical protein [Mycobacterium sp.]
MMGSVLALVDLAGEGADGFLGYDDVISGNSGDSNNCGSGDSRGC